MKKLWLLPCRGVACCNFVPSSSKTVCFQKGTPALDEHVSDPQNSSIYGIGDDVLAVPSFSFMQMRTFTDPARDYGDDCEEAKET